VYQERIRQIYEQLSPGYRRIADFLLNSYREAAFMTAAQVGHAAQADTASVVRFAQRLGYPGYPELIAEVQEEVKSDLRRVYEPGPDEQSVGALFRRSLLEDRNNLDYILLHPQDDEVASIVETLEKARRIYVVADGVARSLAGAFGMRLTALGFNTCELPGDTLSRAALTAWLGPEDAFLGISLSGATPGVAVALKIAREQGAHTVAVVSALTNASARAAECVLLAPAKTTGIMYSITAASTVLQALLQVLTARMQDKPADWVMRTDHLMQRYVEVWREPIASMHDIVQEYNRPRTSGL
jgi:DNA-binding MurR/RpiR family transcriptional regulator